MGWLDGRCHQRSGCQSSLEKRHQRYSPVGWRYHASRFSLQKATHPCTTVAPSRLEASRTTHQCHSETIHDTRYHATKWLRFLILIKSKTISASNTLQKHLTDGINSNKSHKSTTVTDLNFSKTIFSFSFSFFLVWNDAYKTTVGRPSCTDPSIHLFMALTLKISVVRRAHIQAFEQK